MGEIHVFGHPVAAIHGLRCRCSDPRLRESRPLIPCFPESCLLRAGASNCARCGRVPVEADPAIPTSGRFVGAVGFVPRAPAPAMFWKDSGSRSSSGSGRDQNGVGPFGQVRVLIVGDSGVPFATCHEPDTWRIYENLGTRVGTDFERFCIVHFEVFFF